MDIAEVLLKSSTCLWPSFFLCACHKQALTYLAVLKKGPSQTCQAEHTHSSSTFPWRPCQRPWRPNRTERTRGGSILPRWSGDYVEEGFTFHQDRTKEHELSVSSANDESLPRCDLLTFSSLCHWWKPVTWPPPSKRILGFVRITNIWLLGHQGKACLVDLCLLSQTFQFSIWFKNPYLFGKRNWN